MAGILIVMAGHGHFQYKLGQQVIVDYLVEAGVLVPEED
jgi:hypothetical protein